MQISRNISLRQLNTFGIDVSSRFFTEVGNVSEIRELLSADEFRKYPSLILGGGSNILFTKDYDGLVIKNNLKGRDIVSEDENEVILKAGAGENWHGLVEYCVKKGFGGIENLSLIPGSVGAGPMQNIGAYGVEIKDSIASVDYIDLSTGKDEQLKAADCEFAYRSSIFKTRLKGKILITSVALRLSKNPVLNTSYGAIAQELEKMKAEPSLSTVSQAVINIRRSKLPDPAEIGNAGSFFKNPVVGPEIAEKLKKSWPEVPVYQAPDGVKLAAGWLIEKAGWKGKRFNGFGVHDRQALVLVNFGNSKGSDINSLADEIVESIREKFGITLEKEVNII